MNSPSERTPLRYAAPNIVTGLAMFFGLTAMVSATHGEFVFAGWLIIWATFLDRLDGVVARLLKATSEFGDHGRHLIRYSGTENKIRVLVEHREIEECRLWVSKFAAAIRDEIG